MNVASTSSLPNAPYVLVVEDSTINQALARCHLRRLGCTVAIAETGHEAVDAARHTRYDLILMDYRLPGLDGCAVTRTIREHERQQGSARRVPILGLTACSEPDIETRCLRAGMDRCFQKPLNKAVLREISAWLGISTTADSSPPLRIVMRQESSGSVPARAL